MKDYLCVMQKKMTHNEFLSFFPQVELPITLSDENLELFSKNNKVLPEEAIYTFIDQWEEVIDDGMTEYIPCIQLPDQDEFIGIVYWKGGLEKYVYVLVTLSKKGELIARKSIASTVLEGSIVKRSVASIDEDLIIHIVAGAVSEGEEYDPSNSQAFNMEIMTTGDILFSLGEESIQDI